MSELFTRCEYDGVPCNLSQLALTVDRKFGNCFTWEEPHLVAKADARKGLFLQLRLYRNEYMTMVDSVGVQVVVHSRGVCSPWSDFFQCSAVSELQVAALPYAQGFKAAPGFYNSYALDYSHVSRLGAPYPPCVSTKNQTSFSLRGDYSQSVPITHWVLVGRKRADRVPIAGLRTAVHSGGNPGRVPLLGSQQARPQAQRRQALRLARQ